MRSNPLLINQFIEMCALVNGNSYRDTLRDGNTCTLPGGESITVSGTNKQIHKIQLGIPVRKEFSQRPWHLKEDGPDNTRLTIDIDQHNKIEIGHNGLRGRTIKKLRSLKSNCRLQTDFQFIITPTAALEAYIYRKISCENGETDIIDKVRYQTDGSRRFLTKAQHAKEFEPRVRP